MQPKDYIKFSRRMKGKGYMSILSLYYSWSSPLFYLENAGCEGKFRWKGTNSNSVITKISKTLKQQAYFKKHCLFCKIKSRLMMNCIIKTHHVCFSPLLHSPWNCRMSLMLLILSTFQFSKCFFPKT